MGSKEAKYIPRQANAGGDTNAFQTLLTQDTFTPLKTLKNDLNANNRRNNYRRFLYSMFVFNRKPNNLFSTKNIESSTALRVVEMRGVEPLSENIAI